MRNTVPLTIIGNLTSDPELRFTPAGIAVARLTVAVNPRTYDRDSQEWKDGEPSFYRVTAWRQLGENAAESLTKGARVVVAGNLSQRQWRDEKSGETRTAWDLTADAIGPDLSYATARVSKMTRGRDGNAPDDPWASGSVEPPADTEPPF